MRSSWTALLILGLCYVFAVACGSSNDGTSKHAGHVLPVIGEREVVNGDTVYHTIGDWSFYRQDSALVTEDMLAGTPYVVDFFFTSCPTICPRVTQNMLRLEEHFRGTHPELKLISFTIDPKRDSVGHLRNYSRNLGVETADRWWFLTGDKAALYGIADDYFSVAMESTDPASGGFDHSGRILFVDGQGQVRAFANGTDAAEVNDLIEDIEGFLNDSANRG